MSDQISAAANQCNFNHANSLSSALTRLESIFAFIQARLCETGTRLCNFTTTPRNCRIEFCLVDHNVVWPERTEQTQPGWRADGLWRLSPLWYVYLLVCGFRIGKALQGRVETDTRLHLPETCSPLPTGAPRPRQWILGPVICVHQPFLKSDRSGGSPDAASVSHR